MASTFDQREELFSQLGKHKSSKACIYIQKLEDIDISILSQIVKKSIEHIKQLYPN
jgi:hypothetical protein